MQIYSNKSTEKREHYIDAAKGIGILLVIIGHSNPPAPIRQFIYEFHMPLFFMISGYVFQYDKWMALDFRSFLQNKWRAYIPKYFLLAGLNLLAAGGILGFFQHGFTKEWLRLNLNYIYWIFYSKGSVATMPNCTPLWFLTCIFVVNILFFLFMKAPAFLRFSLFAASGFAGWLLYYLGAPKLPWNIDTALTGVVIFGGGGNIEEIPAS